MKPLLTATVPFEDAVAAFELAADRSRAMKVQLTSRGGYAVTGSPISLSLTSRTAPRFHE